jgi:hypothetical protein
MYGLELNVLAGIKCTSWNYIKGLELNIKAGVYCTGWNLMSGWN